MKKFALRCLAFFGVFIAINIALEVWYAIPVKNAIKNKTHRNYLKWNDIHQNKGAYDILILGSSRAYTAYDPKIIDSITGLKSYNMGTASQDIIETYYMLEELLEHQKPSLVVYDFFLPVADNVHYYYQIFSNASFFKSDKRKFNLIVNGYKSDGVINYLLPVIKFKDYIKNDFLGLGETPNKEQNWDRGFHNTYITASKEDIKAFKPVSNLNNTNFDFETFNLYFNKINNLLNQNGIKFMVIRSPYPPSRLALDSNTDEHDIIAQACNKREIPLIDFNTQFIGLFNDEDFMDHHHVNFNGAPKVSAILGNYIKRRLNNLNQIKY